MLHLEAKKTLKMKPKILENQVRSGQLSSCQGAEPLGSVCPGRGGGPNVIVGCVPPLTGLAGGLPPPGPPAFFL